MTLAHSSPPCSQMCRFSCPWTTPPCTSLSPLTWGCPCAAWRYSTNHWPLTSTTSRLLIPPARPPLPTSSLKPNHHHYFLFPTVPRPSTSCGSSCAWQVGVQTLFLCSDSPPPFSSFHTPSPPSPSPACEKAVYPAFVFKRVPPFACFFSHVGLFLCPRLSVDLMA